jgi:hypothetical protein
VSEEELPWLSFHEATEPDRPELGDRLQAWDLAPAERQGTPGHRVTLFSVRDQRARARARAWVSRADRVDVVLELEKRGIQPALCDAFSPFLWVADDAGLRVLSEGGVAMTMDGDRLVSEAGGALRTQDIVAVRAFARHDGIERGVEVATLPNREVTTVLRHPCYDEDSGDPVAVRYQTEWCTWVGRWIAQRANAPFVDAIGASPEPPIE